MINTKTDAKIIRQRAYTYIADKDIKDAFKAYCMENDKIEEYLAMKPKFDNDMYVFLTPGPISNALVKRFARVNKLKYRAIK